MDKGVVNICCPCFYVMPCGDTAEHSHVGCSTMSALKKPPLMGNDQATQLCISQKFTECQYYPRRG